MQIESFRTRLEAFGQSLNRELYLYRSGRKDRLELATLYSDYSDLFSLESIREVESALKAEPFESRSASLDKLLRCLIDQYLEFHTAELREQTAHAHAAGRILLDGTEIRLSNIPAVLRKESDPLRRRKIGEKYARALEESAELILEISRKLREAAARLGFGDYVQARERIAGIEYEKLLAAFELALAAVEDKYLERLRTSMEASLGIPFPQIASWDTEHWEEKNDRPDVFSEADLAGVVHATLSELQIHPEQPESVSLEFSGTAQAVPNASCLPIRVPQEIKIVMSSGSSFRHYGALLHESGRACSLAWTSASLPVEHRIFGDRALREGYAFLLEGFLHEWEWLARMLGFTKSGSFLHFLALNRFAVIRKCAAELRFALRFHRLGSFSDAAQVYTETMESYTGIRHLPELWPACFPDGFAAADYLRGWTFEALLREYLRSRYGNWWASTRAASGFLKEIWETGMLYRADELCRDLGLGELEPQALAHRLREGLQP